MRKLYAIVLMLFCCTASLFANTDTSNPLADPQAIVVCGNARFTVLTSRMIRMEWSPNARFEDRASLAIVNRCLPVPEYSVKKKGKGVIIKTKDLTLNYSGGEFSPASLTVTLKLAGKKRHPTIEDDVTIYSNVSILGGQTVIGKGCTIGGNAFITSSIPPFSRVSVKNPELTVDDFGEKAYEASGNQQ